MIGEFVRRGSGLSRRHIELEPGISTIGKAEECQVFEHNRKCLAIDTKSGI
jgi:hypothetical protein